MKIVVCIKQVPATNDAKIDPETKRIIREGMQAILNPFDTYAIEEAVLLKTKLGGEVIALSMGPEKAGAVLREAISVGADQAILLNDRAFGGSDTWATSYALSKAIQKIGNVDLVICGKQAIDGDTAQVGPGIASHLGWLQATYVMAVTGASDSLLSVKRMNESGYDICDLQLPAVITVLKDINTPRVPTLRGHMAAQKAEIAIWKPDDIGAETDKIGLNGSPTRVVKTQPPAPRQTRSIKIEGTPQECASALLKELRLRNIV
ncbi:MAG: electron transfer flavoprotein subunit beta/FixA family protein [Saccharofermentanales bacterium]